MALSSSALPMVWRVMLVFGSRYCDRALLVLPVATASATRIRSSSRKLLRGNRFGGVGGVLWILPSP